ncbi:hypothetical protein GCM10028817_49300 [Spirosoma pomorum]
MLFTAASGSNSAAKQSALAVKKAVAEKAVGGKATNSNQEEVKLSAAQLEAVVTPAVQIGSSGQTAILLPAPTLVILLLLSVVLLRHFTLPHFYFSYFQHVFGHHIASNAP